MLYVLREILIWVVAASLVGAVFGWWVRSIGARRQVAREAMIWQRRLRQQKALARRTQETPETDKKTGGEAS